MLLAALRSRNLSSSAGQLYFLLAWERKLIGENGDQLANSVFCLSENSLLPSYASGLFAARQPCRQIQGIIDQHIQINIRQPCIVIQGSKDVLVDPKNADFAQKMLVNAKQLEMVIEPNMNHFVPWSHPYLIKNAILKMATP